MFGVAGYKKMQFIGIDRKLHLSAYLRSSFQEKNRIYSIHETPGNSKTEFELILVVCYFLTNYFLYV